jgi:hypothetical protein
MPFGKAGAPLAPPSKPPPLPGVRVGSVTPFLLKHARTVAKRAANGRPAAPAGPPAGLVPGLVDVPPLPAPLVPAPLVLVPVVLVPALAVPAPAALVVAAAELPAAADVFAAAFVDVLGDDDPPHAVSPPHTSTTSGTTIALSHSLRPLVLLGPPPPRIHRSDMKLLCRSAARRSPGPPRRGFAYLSCSAL